MVSNKTQIYDKEDLVVAEDKEGFSFLSSLTRAASASGSRDSRAVREASGSIPDPRLQEPNRSKSYQGRGKEATTAERLGRHGAGEESVWQRCLAAAMRVGRDAGADEELNGVAMKEDSSDFGF
ncbi:uncharacterized protein DS421_16g567270 [Arachis hypogaea]|nr:uncharacterized protein DS421_16g567270 [Arachis hypogaea]